jgi:hypothetical protein
VFFVFVCPIQLNGCVKMSIIVNGNTEKINRLLAFRTFTFCIFQISNAYSGNVGTNPGNDLGFWCRSVCS